MASTSSVEEPGLELGRGEPGAAASAPSDSPRSVRWGTLARAGALGALIGAGVVLAAQLTFQGDWVHGFVENNRLDPRQRTMLIVTALAGAALGAGAVGTGAALCWRRGREVSLVERWAWFLCPLAFLPVLTVFARYRVWDKRYEELLVSLIFVLIFFEAALCRCLRNAPDGVVAWLAKARARVPRLVASRGPWITVLVLALGYAIFFSYFTLRWHWRLRTNNFDLSINNNLMFGGLTGVFNHSPIVFPADPEKYLGTHAKYGGYVFLPLYALYPKPEFLLVMQSTMLGLTAIPLFALAKKYLSPWAAVLVALCFVCYYPMHGANFHEVKWVPVATFFVVSTIWAVDAKRWILLAIVFPIALLMREDVPIGLVILGAFLVATGHRPKAGLVIFLVSAVWFAVLRFKLMEESGKWWFPDMYKDLIAPGDKGFKSVAKTIVSNPVFVLSTLLVKDKFFYVLHLLVPLAFVPLRKLWLWAALIPGTIPTLLTTDYKPTITFSFQYVMHWTPYLFAAAPVALAALARSGPDGKLRMRSALGAMVLSSLILTWNWGAFPMRDTFKGGFGKVTFDFSEKERERYRQVQELVAMIPPDASVSATEKVGPHVSSRKMMYSMRKGTREADYVLAWQKELKLESTWDAFNRAVKKKEYGVFARRGEFVLLKRGHDPSDNEKLVKDWRL